MTKKVFTYPVLTIEIVTSSEATIAIVSGTIEGENFVWEGTAKRFPGDRWVRSIGVKLALSRALQRASKQLAKQGNGAVKNLDDNASREKTPAPKFHTIKQTRRPRRVRTAGVQAADRS